jgi:hypothetical protein
MKCSSDCNFLWHWTVEVGNGPMPIENRNGRTDHTDEQPRTVGGVDHRAARRATARIPNDPVALCIRLGRGYSLLGQ